MKNNKETFVEKNGETMWWADQIFGKKNLIIVTVPPAYTTLNSLKSGHADLFFSKDKFYPTR